jgi:predicted RND superfamily exporter protein
MTHLQQLAENSLWIFLYEHNGAWQQFSVKSKQLRSDQGLIIGRKQPRPNLNINHHSIAKAHCRLLIDRNHQLQMIDLGSNEGVFINEHRLEQGQRQVLNTNDQLRLAKLGLIIIPPPQPPLTVNNNNPKLETKSPVNPSTLLRSRPEISVDHPITLIEQIMTFGARRPVISLLFVLLITALSVFGLFKLELDTRYDSMLDKNDPTLPIYHQVIEAFGSDNLVLIYYQHAHLFNADKLQRVIDVTNALRGLTIVEKVESLVSVLNISHSDQGLVIKPLIGTLPETAKASAKLKEIALHNPLIQGHYLSKDGTKAAIIVTLKPNVNQADFNRKAYDTLEKVIEPLHTEFDNVFQMGNPRVNVEFERGIFSDLLNITPLAILILIASIVLMLRTFMAAILPLITSGLSIIWTLGLLGFCGIPINLLTAILPALVIVIGSTEDTHMLTAYLQAISTNKQQRFPAIRFMAIQVGLPIFITSFTTIIGFLSNSLSSITLVQHFGISSAFAMLANLLVTILMLPLLLQFFGPKKSNITTDLGSNQHWTVIFICFVERISEQHSQKIIIITTIFVLIFGFFALKVTVSNDPLSFFKADNKIVSDSQTLHQNLAGMQVFFVTIHAAQGTDFREPVELKKLEAVQDFMEHQGAYDKILSINDYLKLINQKAHPSKSDAYRIPDTQLVVDNYLTHLQRNQIKKVLSDDYYIANIIVRHNLSDSATLNRYLAQLSDNLSLQLGTTNKFSLTGKNLMVNKAAETLLSSQIKAITWLILIICIVMSLLYSSLTAGFVSLIPNIIPVVIMFGTMGLLGIPLNPGTAIVSVIAIGIAIDDTIHLLSTYNKECRVDGNQIAAARRAVRIEAIPVISTSLALSAGFLILMASHFHIIMQFGLLSALTIIGAMLSDLFITPVLFKRIRLVSLWDVISLDVRQIFTKSDIFAQMTPFQIKRVILLSQVHEYQVGEIVIQQGDIGDKLFIVIAGEADIILNEQGHQQLIARLGWGEVFGEAGYAGYASNTTRTATVRVSKHGQPLQVIMLNHLQVQTAMRFYPRLHAQLNSNINKILTQRLVERTQIDHQK